MLTLNHFFMNGWLPAICVFSQIQFLIQVNTLLVFLKYAEILYLYSLFLKEKCSISLGTGLKKWEAFFRISYFSSMKVKWKERVTNHALILSYEWWETSCKQDNLMQIVAGLAISVSFFRHNCCISSPWVYWELWCQARNQTVMQVGHMLFFFLEQ